MEWSGHGADLLSANKQTLIGGFIDQISPLGSLLGNSIEVSFSPSSNLQHVRFPFTCTLCSHRPYLYDWLSRKLIMTLVIELFYE